MTEKQRKGCGKFSSRKWRVVVWAMSLASVGFVGALICAFTGRELGTGFMGVLGTLCAVPIAYIGGNVYQKNIESREGKDG